jgi:hypothetical protein
MLDQGGGAASMGDDWWNKRQDKAPKASKTQYSDWYSGAYSGCAMCHYSRGTQYTQLTNTQLADADNNAREAAGLATVAAVTGTVIGSGLALAGVSGLAEAACADGDCTNEIGATGEIGQQYLTQAGGQSQAQFQTTQGVRVVDQLVNGMAYESKVGYTPLTSHISLQVSKDVELLVTGQVNSYSWVFFQSPITGAGGPSGPLYNLLIQNGIYVYYVLPYLFWN